MIFQVESSLEQLKDNETFDNDKVTSTIAKAKEALETDDNELLDTAFKSLETVLHDVAKTMYEQVSQQENPDTNNVDADIVDADIVDADIVDPPTV
jgi:hypothetical protein